MIEVIARPPFTIQRTARFRHDGKSSLNVSQTSTGTTAQIFEFAKKVGRLKALLEAFSEAPCTIAAKVVVDRRGVALSGKIVAWDPTFLQSAKDAVVEMEDVAWNIHRDCPECTVTISFAIIRDVASAALR